MDGTETGWSRPAEPAPRWRALLDRARHGGRTAEQTDPADGHAADDGSLRGADDPSGRRAGGNGFQGRATLGPPDDPDYLADLRGPSYGSAFDRRPLDGGDRYGAGRQLPDQRHPERGGPDRSADPRRGESGYPAEYRYTEPDNNYREPSGYPTESRYAALENGYGGYPTESRYAALQPGYPGPEPGYPAPGTPAPGTFATESRYAALDPGYAPPAPPRASAPPPAPPVPPRASAPPPAPPVPPRASAPPPAPPPAPPTAPLPSPAPVPPPSSPTTPPVAPVARPGADPAISARASVGRGSRAGREPGYANALGWRRGRTENETERAIGVLRRELGGPRVIAFANPKGGVHKTTATVLAAATVGSVRGRGVLAWDDNELRGTLGLRAGSARHARTIRHLVSDLVMIEATHGPALLNRLDDFLRHASDGSYDVLAGEESPSFAARLDQHIVGRVIEVLRRSHEVICVDTGNNVESANWQTVLRAADQLVVTTVPREDAAFTADWMLDLLHEIGMGELADNAVTLLSCPTPGRSPLLDDFQRHFATRTRAVAVVPYDPALETGSSIEYGQLQPETREAWYRAASMMIEPFVR